MIYIALNSVQTD